MERQRIRDNDLISRMRRKALRDGAQEFVGVTGTRYQISSRGELYIWSGEFYQRVSGRQNT